MTHATAPRYGLLAQRKDALPMAGSAGNKGATIPPPDTRRSYN